MSIKSTLINICEGQVIVPDVNLKVTPFLIDSFIISSLNYGYTQ